ncbi:MAG: hypothetical protein KDN18_07330 [Verrucomicrobiae bacterium]|nr:hypothetical protein [Verrucomicrobiae bacterium]
MHPLRCALTLPLLLLVSPTRAVDYQGDIQSILKEHCWDCHSNEKEAKGDLAFDDKEDLAKSHINPVGLIRPGEPEKSDFLARLKLDEEDDDFMPRKGKPLRSSELAKIEQWIREGALIDAANPTETEKGRMEEVKLANALSGGDVYFQWTNTQGKVIEAKYAGLEGESVKITMKTGKSFLVPLNSLSAESAALARKLGGK